VLSSKKNNSFSFYIYGNTITYNDAETGENIGFSTHSLDKDGMKIKHK
jgi:hypothetical protein